MKETYSFSLEQEAFNKIIDYQYQLRISSRSAALEKLLMEEIGTQEKFGVYDNLPPDEALEKLFSDFKIAHDRIINRYSNLEKENNNLIDESEELAITTENADDDIIQFVIEEEPTQSSQNNRPNTSTNAITEDKIIRTFQKKNITKETKGTSTKKSSIVKMALDSDEMPD